MAEMRVLITGGSGFVGVALAEALLGAGTPVVVFDRSPPPAPIRRHLDGLPGGYRVVEGDVREAAAVAATLAEHRITHLVHAAVITAGAERELSDARTVAEVNFLGTLAALEAARGGRLARMVYVSSGSVYGKNAFGERPLDEATTIPLPDSLYAITKYAAERVCLRFGERTGMDVRAARVGTVFGPWERETGLRDTMSPPFQLMRLARRGERALLARDARRDWIYSRDVAQALRAVLGAARLEADVVNIGPGAEWTLLRFAERLATHFPGFGAALAGPGKPANVDLFGDRDRAPLATARLRRDVGYQPRFGCTEAADDYARWVLDNPALAEACFG